jgi:hypothetical protein
MLQKDEGRRRGEGGEIGLIGKVVVVSESILQTEVVTCEENKVGRSRWGLPDTFSARSLHFEWFPRRIAQSPW